MLDDLRIEHGRLDAPGADRRRAAARCTSSSTTPTRRCCRPASATTANDSRILACALNLAAERPAGRGRAGHQGHAAAGEGGRGRAAADEYRAQRRRAVRLDRDGRARRSAPSEVDTLFHDGRDRPRRGPRAALPHRAAAARRRPVRRWAGSPPDKQVRLVRGDREAFGLHGRSAEQRIALDLLLDAEVGIVSLGGRAGTGKSALALCAGLEAVMERRAAPQGRGVPAAVRRRRPGARLPAGQREREDGALGAGGLRHARRAGQPGRHRRGHRPRACSRCCR